MQLTEMNEKKQVATAAEAESDTNTNQPHLPRLAYSLAETATILGISYVSVRRLVYRGLLKTSTALRHRLVPHCEIEKFLRATSR